MNRLESRRERAGRTGFLLALLGWFPAASLGQGPNVLLIVADDIDVDMLSAYGEASQYPPIPNIEALRAQGVLHSVLRGGGGGGDESEGDQQETLLHGGKDRPRRTGPPMKCGDGTSAALGLFLVGEKAFGRRLWTRTNTGDVRVLSFGCRGRL